MKKPLTERIGLLNRMAMAPPSSNATFVPEYGGNAKSLREIPEDSTVEFWKIIPNDSYWVEIGVWSYRSSNLITAALVTADIRNCKVIILTRQSQVPPFNKEKQSLPCLNKWLLKNTEDCLKTNALEATQLIMIYFIRNRHHIEADLLDDAILPKSKELHDEQLSDNLFNGFF